MLQKIDQQNETQVIKRRVPKLSRGADAKVVAQGNFFKIWQWQQTLYDGSQTTFESISRADTVTILALTEDKQLIFTKQSQPGFDEFLSMPGGVIDEGESVLQAAQRELLEETGFVSEDWYFLFSGQMNSRIDWANFYIVAKNCQKVADIRPDAGEKISLEFFDLKQIPELIKKPNFRNSDFTLWYLRTGGVELEKL